MSEKRRGLGRGLGALIPSSASAGASGNGVPASRPVDLFFPEARKAPETVDAPEAPETEVAKSSPSRGSSSKSTTAAKSPAAKSPAAKVTPAKTTDADRSAGSKPVGAAAATSGEAVADSLPSESSGVQLVEVPGARFAEIPVGDIHPNRKQPRSVFDEDDMAELVHSVKEIGVLQPIVVRTSTEKGGEPYELVMGERRWRAVQAAGLETIPAIVRDTTDDDLLRDALLENLHRSQLNPLEEAAAYQQLLEDFGTTHEQLADRIGRSRPQVSNTLRLLKLPPLVQRRVAASVLSAGHARALLALPDAASMERLAQKIVAEGMSVRATEEAVALYQDPTVPPKNSIPRPNARHERLDYLASSLSDRLDTNVKITLGARKGRVSIEFASVEDLNRIMDVLSPGDES
ncbi:ParB/RepB/Spo0J family partition protein [Arthrobacter bambusae]|jgi:ParB family transcriptional regulator, chromosome partitioning protein|uniref:ParB/RepB/Spo0J family partition protein n=1 Tax=Arthrobacter TaxID=1663 RepID=UPI001F50BD89|nr:MULTISPECIES: ParB/RepB/Spo0J family partition protein [Arthrobacter]MCI0140781.1 ParB/RepB/Spo0J family partition protein [Arthrobacter bambusae]UYY81501.1 ParB/RepB/Spo0J family partition protein [Arthrobacter sp. YA7-1]